MTIKEYFNYWGETIGLCELCKNFKHCAERGDLEMYGCDYNTYLKEE